MLSLYLSMLNTDAEREQFRALYMYYREKMFRIAMKYLKDEYLAEDAVHNAFLKLINHFDKFDKDISASNNKAMVITATKSASIDMLRKKKGELPLDTMKAPVDTEFLEHIEVEEIVDMIMKLPLKQQQMLMLKYFHEMKVSDIAEMFGMSYAATQKFIYRAQATLAATIKESE